MIINIIMTWLRVLTLLNWQGQSTNPSLVYKFDPHSRSFSVHVAISLLVSYFSLGKAWRVKGDKNSPFNLNKRGATVGREMKSAIQLYSTVAVLSQRLTINEKRARKRDGKRCRWSSTNFLTSYLHSLSYMSHIYNRDFRLNSSKQDRRLIFSFAWE